LEGQEKQIAVEFALILSTKWHQTSRFRESVKICRNTLNLVKDCCILCNLAQSEKVIGEINEALGHYQQALDICPSGDEKIRSTILHGLAGIYQQKGNLNKAKDTYISSLRIKENNFDIQGQARTLYALASICTTQGDISQGLTIYDKCLQLFKQINDIEGQASTLNNIGLIYSEQGKIEQAIDLYQQSKELRERIGDIRGQASTLNNIAVIYIKAGRTREAFAFCKQSLKLKEQIGDISGQAVSLHQMAFIKDEQGEFEKAFTLYQASYKLGQQIQDVEHLAKTSIMMAQLLATYGEFAKALFYLQESFDIFQKLKSPQVDKVKEIIAGVHYWEHITNIEGKATTFYKMAIIGLRSRKLNEAIALLKKSLQHSNNSRDIQIKAAALTMLGQLLANEKGDFVTALEYLQQSLEIFQRIQSPHAETVRGFINDVQQMANG
jgi:tetratricopeptide (TPR) repeat protein